MAEGEGRPTSRTNGHADDAEDAYQAWLQDRAERAILAAGASVDEATELARSVLVDFAGVADGLGRGLPVDMPAVLAAYDITGEMDAADLLRLELPPLRAIVPDIIVAGTTVLAAPPKIGKSVLCYQLAVEVALGGTLLGRQCVRGSVLYLALEDGKRRGQDRLRAALNGRRMPAGRLSVGWDAPVIGGGLEEKIEVWLAAHDDAALVMIDTVQKIRGKSDGRRNAYEVDVQDLGRLQNITRDRSELALLGVHHTKKDAADDFVASVSGTYGIAGSADTIMLLKRKRHAELGVLEITGRELPETELPVKFADLRWDVAENVIPGASSERLGVYEVIRARGPIFPAAISRELRVTRELAAYHVKALESDGLVTRAIGGYIVADPSVSVIH
jgi:hypothetical protein